MVDGAICVRESTEANGNLLSSHCLGLCQMACQASFISMWCAKFALTLTACKIEFHGRSRLSFSQIRRNKQHHILITSGMGRTSLLKWATFCGSGCLRAEQRKFGLQQGRKVDLEVMFIVVQIYSSNGDAPCHSGIGSTVGFGPP